MRCEPKVDGYSSRVCGGLQLRAVARRMSHMELRVEKATRVQFGTVRVFDPSKVVRLGLPLLVKMKTQSIQIWADAEYRALEQGLEYDPKDIFYSEETPAQNGAVLYQFRYYTPISNRVPPKKLPVAFAEPASGV